MMFLRRYGRTLLWFISALAAFAHAIVLKAQERPPLRVSIPVRQTSSEKIIGHAEYTQYSITLKGEAEFVNEYPATLKSYTSDLAYGLLPTYNIEIRCDGAHHDYLHHYTENNQPLPAGQHTYDAIAELNLLAPAPYNPPMTSEITLLVEYPTQAKPWQGPCLLGITFLVIGILQRNRMRRA